MTQFVAKGVLLTVEREEKYMGEIHGEISEKGRVDKKWPVCTHFKLCMEKNICW